MINEDILELVEVNIVLSYKNYYDKQKLTKQIKYLMQLYLISSSTVFNTLPIKNGTP